MQILHKLLKVFPLVGTVFLAACVHYQPVTPSGVSFEGLKQTSADVGLVRVFFIHGITTTYTGYSYPFACDLGAKLGLKSTHPDGPDPNDNHNVNDADGYPNVLPFPRPATLQIYRFADASGQIRLVSYEFLWSPLTSGPNGIKTRVLGEDEGVPRAIFNQEVKKGLLDDGLSEAVLYIEQYHLNVMHRATLSALKSFITGQYDAVPNNPSKIQVALFTHSLGSIILCDALQVYWRNYLTKAKPDLWAARKAMNVPLGAPAMSEAVPAVVQQADPEGLLYAKMLSETRFIYLFANQIPLLEIAKADFDPIYGSVRLDATISETKSEGKAALASNASSRLGNLILQYSDIAPFLARNWTSLPSRIQTTC